MTRAFVVVPTRRGPVNPPMLGAFVDWRPESAPLCFWAKRENGELAGRFRTAAEAQAALSKPSRAIGE